MFNGGKKNAFQTFNPPHNYLLKPAKASGILIFKGDEKIQESLN